MTLLQRRMTFWCKSAMSAGKKAWIAAVLVLLATPPARSFDYSTYSEGDLDAIASRSRPATGADIMPPTKLRIRGTLVGYGESCSSGLLKAMMVTQGLPKATVDAIPITHCIRLRTAKGKVVRLYIQDPVASFLPNEVPLGSELTLYVIHAYTDSAGPGLLVNEFDAPKGNAAAPKR